MNVPKLRDTTSGHELQKLQVSHEKIVALTAMGMSRKDVATEIDCSVDKVGYVINGAIGGAKLEEIKAAAQLETVDIARNIHQVAEKAIKLMDEVVSGENKEAGIKERLDIAKQVLHMDGFAPVQKQIIDVNRTNAEKIGLDQIRERAAQLHLLSKPVPEAKVIEADFTPVHNLDNGEMPEGL